MINKTSQDLANLYPTSLKDIQDQVLQLKTKQPAGIDSMNLKSTNLLVGGPVTIAAGGALTFNVSLSAASGLLTLWNILHDVIVDTLDIEHIYPDGVNLTSGQKNMLQEVWWSWADSSDSINSRMYKVRVRNLDAVAHNYYIIIRGYLPA